MPSSGKKSVKSKTKPRASVLQECFGILVVVFGGETFLGEIKSPTLLLRCGADAVPQPCALAPPRLGLFRQRFRYCSR
jgi:hypothetical protein